MVVEASASVRTFHLTIAGEKVAAHAIGQAVFLVLAKEVFVGDLSNPLPDDVVCVIEDRAGYFVHVHDLRMSANHVGVHVAQPLEMTVADKRIFGQEKERGI